MALRICLGLLLTGVFTIGCNTESKSEDVLKYVDPFIGTDYHGHTYPGVTIPFGMVQLSPDTRVSGWDACSGYHYSDKSILGFSHTHLSGTGIGDYGDVLIMPYTGPVSVKQGSEKNPDTGYRSRFSKITEEASPGYYSVLLSDYNIKAELSATTHAGIHRYTYPASENSGVIIDLTHTIHEHKNIDNVLRVLNEYEIEGLKHTQGWAYKHYAYFRIRFSKPVKVELYQNDKKVKDVSEIIGSNVKAKVSFSTAADEQVLIKVGISGVDFAGAEKNLNAELDHNDFESVVADAKSAWEEQLQKIKITDLSEENKRTFYTALYRVSLSPHIYSDVDGRYRGMNQEILHSEENNYTVFSLWDTYRATHPLFTIIEPEFDQKLIRALLRKYDEGGILPMWELASNYTGTMIGSHSIPVIVDAYMKGLHDFDADKALEAMIHAVSYDTVKEISYQNKEAHVNLMPKSKMLIEKYGFVPCDLENASVSQGLEFAYNFWCIATMAKSLGKNDIAEEYYKKAQSYKFYFDKETGFMRGKNLDGSWKNPFDPRYSDHWKTPYVEGNAWQWSWYVPHDVSGLMDLHGGPEMFAVKLDSLFMVDSEVLGEGKSLDITGLIGQYAHGNEPSHHIAYLFNYAGKPWRTQELVTRICNEQYSDKPDGLCGNEDCGQMSAWYILNSLGFYPVCPGDTKYSLGIPAFDKAEIKVGEDKTFTVISKDRSEQNKYVKRVLLDGKPIKSQFIDHSDIIAGKTLTFEFGPDQVVFWEQ
ncbi:MAG: GH92 family glycosyl hydrolase [Bacteroidales bacterium]|nr:GH92 family glycosyl hydrolase [Bacteroidales bacterium]